MYKYKPHVVYNFVFDNRTCKNVAVANVERDYWEKPILCDKGTRKRCYLSRVLVALEYAITSARPASKGGATEQFPPKIFKNMFGC